MLNPMDIKRARLANAEKLLKEAGRLIFEAQMNLGNGVESEAWNQCNAADTELGKARARIQGIAMSYGPVT